MQETINEIVRASRFPMSIVIVGVGDEDFGMMDELDADIVFELFAVLKSFTFNH